MKPSFPTKSTGDTYKIFKPFDQRRNSLQVSCTNPQTSQASVDAENHEGKPKIIIEGRTAKEIQDKIREIESDPQYRGYRFQIKEIMTSMVAHPSNGKES